MEDKIGYINLDDVIGNYLNILLERKRKDLEENPPQNILEELKKIEQTKEIMKKEVMELFRYPLFKKHCDERNLTVEYFCDYLSTTEISAFLSLTQHTLLMEEMNIYFKKIEDLDSIYANEIHPCHIAIEAIEKTHTDPLSAEAEEKVRKAYKEVVDEENYTLIFKDTSMFTLLRKDIYDLTPKVFEKLS